MKQISTGEIQQKEMFSDANYKVNVVNLTGTFLSKRQ